MQHAGPKHLPSDPFSGTALFCSTLHGTTVPRCSPQLAVRQLWEAGGIVSRREKRKSARVSPLLLCLLALTGYPPWLQLLPGISHAIFLTPSKQPGFLGSQNTISYCCSSLGVVATSSYYQLEQPHCSIAFGFSAFLHLCNQILCTKFPILKD